MDIRLTTVSFLCVLVAAHVVNVFLSWVIHYVQHQRVLGVDLYRIHLEGHHALDRHVPAPRLRRFWNATGHALWAVLILLFWAVYYFAFVEWVALTFMAESVVLSIGIYYLHREYDDADSWLNRFAWFTRARTLHEIHHAHDGDFSRSINYAIGGPLVGALPDRLFATFRDVPEAHHASVVAAGSPGPPGHSGDGGRRSSRFGPAAGGIS